MKKPSIQIDKEKVSALVKKGKRIAKDTAYAVKDGIKQGGDQLSDYMDQAKLDWEKKQLCPIFQSDFDSEEYEIPRMIRIVDYDKKHMDSKACEGSLGFETATKHMKVLTLYSDAALSQDTMNFYPSVSETIYYADPCRDNCYISLDEYFDHLKKVRVDELETIAQDLGAKHVKITFKEIKKTFVSQKKKSNTDIDAGALDITSERSAEDYSSMEVAADVSFSGNDKAICPQPIYFKNESDIQALIRARMNPDANNPIKSKTYKIKYDKTSGISEKVAANIDEALALLKCNGTASVSSEAQKEKRTVLEYHIEF